ncbi:MAG TPA: restriction endonuclease subunit S [Candidatus Ignatzschineria merdigallinarum]|uniref:Restriction endonuclease subunit S n=1 Tax=Candidatus Ignatzschineria merdigallinarum TaxID=2838621 RepID=A0A9D1Q4S8_9GAMM|nr:restriction endonuclease subunit S [Candidatus Ignatzschineria merdigallinarum]
MAKNKMNIPQIRFKGFEGEWGKKPFSKIYSYVRNGFVGTATPHYVEQGVPYIQGRNIKCGKLLDNGYVNISEEFHKSKPNSKVLVNDLLIVQSGHVGDTAVVCSKFEGANCHAILVATPANQLECNSYFYNSYFLSDSGKAKIQIITTGNTVKHILSSDLKTLIVPKPTYHEQTQIGDFFQKIDQVIELQQKALDTARAYKQSMLQKMFPQKGEKVPRVRFAGFSGDWNELKLAKLVSFSKGKGYSKSSLVNEGNPIILYGSLYTDYRSNIDNVTTFAIPLENSIYSEGNEIILPSSGESDVDIARASAVTQKGVLLGGDLNVLKPKKDFNNIFMALNLTYSSVNSSLVKRAQGQVVVHLYNSDIQNLKVSLPMLEEQTKISDFFQKLDQQIEQQAQKLATYQQLKKAMLQRMFV